MLPLSACSAFMCASAVVVNVVYKSCFVPGRREKHGNYLVGKGLAFDISSKVSPKLKHHCVDNWNFTSGTTAAFSKISV